MHTHSLSLTQVTALAAHLQYQVVQVSSGSLSSALVRSKRQAPVSPGEGKLGHSLQLVAHLTEREGRLVCAPAIKSLSGLLRASVQ